MGKSKARIFRKGINDQIPRISRADAISETVKHLETKNINDAKNLITMFGLSAEEILEAGGSYEAVIASLIKVNNVKKIISKNYILAKSSKALFCTNNTA